QFGTVQLFDEATGELRIAAQHGFSTSIGEAVASIERHEESACGRALRRGATVRVSDIEQDAAYVSLRTGNKEAGFNAVQCTALVGQDGTLVGVLSVYFRELHQFSDRDTQLIDVIGRQAADLIVSRAQHERL